MKLLKEIGFCTNCNKKGIEVYPTKWAYPSTDEVRDITLCKRCLTLITVCNQAVTFKNEEEELNTLIFLLEILAETLITHEDVEILCKKFKKYVKYKRDITTIYSNWGYFIEWDRTGERGRLSFTPKKAYKTKHLERVLEHGEIKGQ